MAVNTGDRLLRFLTSGKFENPRDDAVMDEIVRYIMFNVALIIGAVLLISFGITVISTGNTVRGAADILMGLMCILVVFLLRTRTPFLVSGLIPLIPFGLLCVILVMSGGERGFAGLWIYVYPLIVIFTLGLYAGSILSGMVLLGTIIVTVIPGLSNFNYFLPMIFRMAGVYILVLVLTMVYEQSRLLKDRWVRRLTAALRAERDEITVMKDNLKTGIFLMDKDYIIQPSYSKSLEGILGDDELQGKKFTDFLASSVKAGERDTLEDYFGMILNRAFDAAMLEEINPIDEFVYVNERQNTKKTLRSSFAVVDRGQNHYILGTLEDITAEKLLKQQLEEEESKREGEMRAFFQVIHVDPKVFSDFIEDTDYEFNRINVILKDQELSAREAMVNIYQSVHAIKSNALILGLENFSDKLHTLESGIKDLRDGDEISFEDVLHITVELEKIMKETDKFREIIDRLRSFNAGIGGNRRQDRYVLVETLSKACEKAAQALNKKAQFIVEDLDGIVLEHGPRRVIKEVLTQLVRNAVYHGLEDPEERTKLGKNAEGKVQLSIKYGGNEVHIKLSDDGKGLDFDKIRRKAEDLHLLQDILEAENESQLSQVIFAPGFSTANTADMHAGRGIGLNLVQERVQDLHGSIKLQSEPGKGTVFNIYIPLELKSNVDKAS
jgi:two-component system chemotaxis sensor kinase CheA